MVLLILAVLEIAKYALKTYFEELRLQSQADMSLQAFFFQSYPRVTLLNLEQQAPSHP
jgi:hypothetical protein